MQEINELKNLVVQSLESHGVLSQLRAQIRSSVFKIIDMQETQNNKKTNSFFWENPLCQKIYDNENGSLAVEIITEFLQFYKMDYTLNVFPHESNLKEEVTREKLSKRLGINAENDQEKGAPVLIHIIKHFLQNLGNNNSSQFKKNSQDDKKEEIKENFVQTNKEVKKEINKEIDFEKPNLNKKDFEISKEIPEIKKQEQKPSNQTNLKTNQIKEQKEPEKEVIAPNKKNDFQFGKEKEKDNSANDIIKEKKAFVETQQKLGEMEKKINSKQIAEIPALPIKKEVEKPPQNLQQIPEKKHEPKQPEVLVKSKEDHSHNYEDEHFDDYNEEEVNEEIFHEDENIDELMYRQQEGQMDMHGQQPGIQSSDENFGISQSQGFDILVNSTTLEEYDYFEDVVMP